MKKGLAALLALALVFGLSACGGEAAAAQPSAPAETTAPPSPTPAPTPEPEPEATPGFQYQPPAGWQADADSEAMFFAPDYPEDSSNINYTEEEPDENFDAYTAHSLEVALSQTLSQSLEEEIHMEVAGFERLELGGLPAFRLEYSFLYQDVPVKQVLYSVNGSRCWSLTLTQVGDADWTAAFDASVAAAVFPG